MYKFIYKTGVYIRNKTIFKHLRELITSDFAGLASLEEIQLRRLKKLLVHARENSPYFNKQLAGLDLENCDLSILEKIPTLSKQALRENILSIQNDYGKKQFLSSTSGSTGNALVFKRDEEWDGAHRAAQLRGYSWYDVNPWDKNLYFWGFNPSFIKKLKIRLSDLLLNRYRVFNYDGKSIQQAKNIIEKSKFIEGYSSSIFSLAQLLDKEGMKYEHVSLVKGTSEKIFDYYHNSVKAVFGKKMVSEYGAAETGIIAFECPVGNMHVTMENLIVEEVDNKIVVTNLFSFSCPIIRYELGDYIRLNKDFKCSCGRKHHVIEEVTGRIGENIKGFKNSYLSLTLYYVFKNISLEKKTELAYFACQKEEGRLIIKVLSEGEDNDLIQGYIIEELQKYFSDDIEARIIFVDRIEMMGKKSQSFVSYLNSKDKERCQ